MHAVRFQIELFRATEAMMQRLFRSVMTLALCLLAGCAGTQPSRFYMLTAVPPGDGTPIPVRASTTITVGPVELPKYADRPQIVIVTAPTQLQMAEYDRWAEPLALNFARVMAENLKQMTPADRVEVYPYPASLREPATRQVVVQVLRFHAASDGAIELTATWNIFDQEGRRSLASGTSSATDHAPPGDYQAITLAMSRTVAGFSKQVATAYNSLSTNSSSAR